MKTTIFVMLFSFIGFMQITLAQTTNLLVNGNFESSSIPDGNYDTPIKGWYKSWYPYECGNSITTTAKHTGKNGLWIYTCAGTNAFSKLLQEIKCKPACKYKVTVFARNPQGYPWSDGSIAYIGITFFNKFGNSIGSEVVSEKFEKNKDYSINKWKEINLIITTPVDAKGIVLNLTLKSNKGISVLNFDNCQIIQI